MGLIVENEPLKPIVQDAVVLTIDNFVKNYTGAVNEKQVTERTAHILNTIRAKYADKLSMFGLVHAFDLLSECKYPCEVRLDWYNGQGISTALNSYIAHCEREYDEFIKDVAFAENAKKEDAISPEQVQDLWKKGADIAKRLEVKYGTVGEKFTDQREWFKENKDKLQGIEKQYRAEPTAEDFD